MYLIVGLGNPGKRFDFTRHNAGFLVLDVIAARLQAKVDRIKFRSLIAETRIDGEKAVLMKPQTFMNLSGEAVRAAAEYYKIPSEKIIVIYDDIDIPFGSLRLRPRGSSGTHNGMRNIVYQLETEEFPRVKVGIRGERHGAELHEYVLSTFSKEEAAHLEEILRRAADATLAAVKDGVDSAMNRYNQTPNQNPNRSLNSSPNQN